MTSQFNHRVMVIEDKLKITLTVSFITLALFFLSLSINSFAASNTGDHLDKQTLVSKLREGGYNIYFRHEATDWSQSDNVKQIDDWLSCDGTKIRQLSDAGRNSAIATGASIKSLKIPIGRIMASPYCRTMETARLFRLGAVEATREVINLRVAEFFGGRATIISSAQELLAKKPSSGKNNIIVAHGNVARNATPVYPDEGEAVVFKPDTKGGFTLVGRLTAEEWVMLAETAGQ